MLCTTANAVRARDAGQVNGGAGEPDADTLAARLQEVAAAQVELTVELPADFFASPQVVCHAGAIIATVLARCFGNLSEADHLN